MMLPKFKDMIAPGGVVLDVGKSSSWDYQSLFSKFDYKTVDILPDTRPDIIADMEHPADHVPSADALICNGVTEQCNNPFDLIRGVRSVMRPNGLILFGVISTAYPVYLSRDYFRFTVAGFKKVIALNNLQIIDYTPVLRNDAVSYIYAICK
jgi:hypothetical protein